MQWSKLRTQVEDLFADCVRGRVRFHSTRYRRMHDQEGRAWITIDGQEIINMPWPAPQKLFQSLRESSRTWEGARRTLDVEEAKAA